MRYKTVHTVQLQVWFLAHRRDWKKTCMTASFLDNQEASWGAEQAGGDCSMSEAHLSNLRGGLCASVRGSLVVSVVM